jgi:PAS domain S-box-containing protein
MDSTLAGESDSEYAILKEILKQCQHCETYKNFESKLDRLSERVNMMNESLALDNISFVGSEVGKGFREGYGRILLENMADGIIIFDESGKIQAFNSVAEEIFSYSAEEAHEEHIHTLIPKLGPETYVQYMKIGNEGKSDQRFGNEVTGINKSGDSVSCDLEVKKIDFNGYLLFMVVIRQA